MIETAKQFIHRKQQEHFKKFGVYADTNSKIAEFMLEFTRIKCQDLLEIVADKAEIGMKKKSNYGSHRKWQKVKEGEVDLFAFEVQYFVDKDSILKAVDLEKFCS